MDRRWMFALLAIFILQQGVTGARLQSRAVHSRSLREAWSTTEGELASQTATPNVIAWLDHAVHGHVMDALSEAGARMTQHDSGHLQHWEF